MINVKAYALTYTRKITAAIFIRENIVVNIGKGRKDNANSPERDEDALDYCYHMALTTDIEIMQKEVRLEKEIKTLVTHIVFLFSSHSYSFLVESRNFVYVTCFMNSPLLLVIE